ncbi:MAG: SurA N-terminal domain-containing protein [Thermodesulfobacteriota bacterium]
MLERIRNSKKSAVILGAFAIIILVFIFWGAGPSGNKGNDRTVVATVDGAPISTKEYAALYKRQLDYYRNRFKGQPVDEIVRRLDLKHRVLDTLIDRAIALEAARDKGMEVSAREVQEAIMAISVFSKDGVFDKKLYFDVLSSNRITPAEFEKGVQDDLLASRMREDIIKDVSVSEAEVKDAYMKLNRKVDLRYIVLDPGRFKDGVKVDKEEAMQFLRENGSIFMLPAEIKAFYAYAGYDTFARGVKVPEAEIKDYYEKNSNDFMTEGMVKARHILIRPVAMGGKDLGTATKEARKKAEEILSELKAGASFSKLARKYSKDPGSARQGGDLGWFQRGVMIKPFEDVVFSMKKGETSGVVETEFGFHIIRLDDRKESVQKPLAEVRDSIREKLAARAAKAEAHDASINIMNEFKAAKTEEELKKAASVHDGVKAVSTPMFTERDSGIALNDNEMVKDVVFSLRQGEVSRLLETPEGIYVIKIVERIDPHVPEYDAVAPQIKAILTERKAVEAAGEKAAQLLERIRNGEDLAEIAKKERYKVRRTGWFTLRDGVIPKIGAYAGDKPDIFSLTEEEPYYKTALNYENRYYILKLASAKEAPASGFEADKEDLTKRLLTEKQNQKINGWFEARRAKTKIQVFEERL